MREELKDLTSESRHEFVGKFVRTGYKKGYKGYEPTILFRRIRLVDNNGNNTIAAKHLWLNYTKGFLKLGELVPGDVVKFTARVNTYLKGPKYAKVPDYGLSYPSKVSIVGNKTVRHAMPIKDPNAVVGYVMVKNKQLYDSRNSDYEESYDSSHSNDYVNSYEAWLANNYYKKAH